MKHLRLFFWTSILALCLHGKAEAKCADLGVFGDGGTGVGCGQNLFLAQTGSCYSAHGQTNRRAGESSLAAYSRACGYAAGPVFQAAQNAGWYNPNRPGKPNQKVCGGALNNQYPATNYIKGQLGLPTTNLVLRLFDDFQADIAVANGCAQFQR